MASLKADTTFAFFSLNFSNMGAIIIDEYCENFLRSPVANRPKHLAARATTMTFASFEIICKQSMGNTYSAYISKSIMQLN